MLTRAVNLPKNHSFILFGPRQTGKSTLLRTMFAPEKSLYFDLLQQSEYQRYLIQPGLFRTEVLNRQPNITHVIVDEIQRVPGLLNEVHSLMETEAPPVFCISGSSARKLKRSQSNLLAGRAWMFHLFPFTHRELAGEFSLDRALQWGTLPPVYLDHSETGAGRTLRSYAETYLNEEIKAEALVRNISAFYRFISIAADTSGGQINYSSIARQTGATYNTVKEFFSILEDTLAGAMLFPYIKSTMKRLVKQPKFYFFDTGVLRALRGRISSPLVTGSAEYGMAFEHFIINEVVRLCAYAENDYRLYYYRTANGAEVDLIVEIPDGRLVAVEIKAGESPHSSELHGLFSFKGIAPKAELVCVCRTPRRFELNGVKIVPWNELFDLLKI